MSALPRDLDGGRLGWLPLEPLSAAAVVIALAEFVDELGAATCAKDSAGTAAMDAAAHSAGKKQDINQLRTTSTRLGSVRRSREVLARSVARVACPKISQAKPL